MNNEISVNKLIARFWKKTTITWFLVLLEALLLVISPIVIGWAVDDLLNKSFMGMYKLGSVSFLLLIVGASRRFYDTRIYANIYKIVSEEIVLIAQTKGTKISKLSARVNLFNEFIKFLETSIPGIINHVISLLGTLIVVFFINKMVFIACLATVSFSMMIYKISEKKYTRSMRNRMTNLKDK